MISRGLAVPFKWGIGPLIPLYEALDIVRSDDCDHVHPIFTVQLADSLELLEQVNYNLRYFFTSTDYDFSYNSNFFLLLEEELIFP